MHTFFMGCWLVLIHNITFFSSSLIIKNIDFLCKEEVLMVHIHLCHMIMYICCFVRVGDSFTCTNPYPYISLYFPILVSSYYSMDFLSSCWLVVWVSCLLIYSIPLFLDKNLIEFVGDFFDVCVYGLNIWIMDEELQKVW